MAYSESWNGYCSYKAQSGLGVQASGSGALILPQAGGQGGRLSKTPIEDPIIRRDGMQVRGRHGSQRTSGSYNTTVAIGQFDPVLAAIMRTTWSAADLELDEGDFTSITTGANTIILASGSPISLGLRVGDVIRLTNQATSTANNGKNLRITGLTSTTITVAETLTVNAVADTECEITRAGRVLVNPAAGSLVKTYFTIEEHEYDLDQSELFTDCVFTRLRIAMAADGILTAELGWTGTGQFEALPSGSSPHFSSPTEPTALSLAALEATLRVGTTDIVDLTSFDITIDLQSAAPAVTGPSKYAPDVFTATQMVSMNLTTLRKDMLDVADFLAENQVSLHLLATENESEPKSFFSLVVPNFTYGAIDKSEMSKAAGARTTTRQVPSALIGVDTRGGAYPATQVQFQVSNAT